MPRVEATALGALNAKLTFEASEGERETALIQVQGTFVGTLTFRASVDGTNFVATRIEDIAAGTFATTATAPGLYRLNLAGFRKVEVEMTAYTSGTATVSANIVRES